MGLSDKTMRACGDAGRCDECKRCVMATNEVEGLTLRLMQKIADAPEDAADAPSPVAVQAARAEARKRPGKPKSEKVWTMPGVGPLTPIPTMLGNMPAQALRERDLVRTATGEYRPLVRVDKIILDEEFLSLHPEALPVLVRRDSMHRGTPSTDLLFSPGQPLKSRTKRFESGCEYAIDLVGRPFVTRKAEAMFTYIVLHLAAAAVVPIDGFYLNIGPLEAPAET